MEGLADRKSQAEATWSTTPIPVRSGTQMAASEESLRQRLFVAQESFDTELKSWIDPATDPGRAFIAKNCFALRNNNGGFLIIGIKDDGSCQNAKIPANIRERYHQDLIQEIVAKYASESFEVTVHFVAREGHPRVMIEVPVGVRTPVFCRNNLPMNNDDPRRSVKSLLRKGEFYVRTLDSNHRISTAPAGVKDWPRIMEFCFNNREADIGRFIRRQLSGLDTSNLTEAFQSVWAIEKTPAPDEVLNAYLDEMYARFVEKRNKWDPRPPETGTRESAAIILGDFQHPDLSRDYMMRFVQVPHHSGWPPWGVLMYIHASIPRVSHVDDGWESFEYATSMFRSLDFSRMEASGRFYYLEGLRDDLVKNVVPGEHLEFAIEIGRVTEVIAACLAFAKEFCGPGSNNDLAFAFRWRGIGGRRLSTWASPNRGWSCLPNEPADQDELVTYVTLPVETPPDAIGPHAEAVVRPLFRLFKGWAFESSVIQDIVTNRLNNRG